MQGEYTIPTELKILYIALAFALAIAALVLLDGLSGYLIIVPVLMLVAAICIVLMQIRSRIIVSEVSIARIGLFQTTELPLINIKGIRNEAKTLQIVPDSLSLPVISISKGGLFDDQQELRDWLTSTFTDLHDQERQQELNDVRNNTRLGASEQDRMEKLEKERRLAWGYNIGSAVLFILSLIWKSIAVVPLMLVYPLVSILLIRNSKGLIKFLSSKSSPLPSVFIGMFFSAMILFGRVSSWYHVLSYVNFWLPFLIIAALTSAMFYVFAITADSRTLKGQIVFIFIISILYSFGSVLLVNCAYDHSRAQRFGAQVIGHRINHGKSNTYYLYLTPWGPKAQPNEISVSRYLYERADVGANVKIYLHQGLLHIPWFVIRA
jgi:hypothetical protein